jgi:hypothetical protein
MTKEQLVEKLGIQALDQEAQDRMLQEVANTVSTRIMAKLSEQLNDNDLEELSKLIDAGQDDQIEEYIYKKMPDYDNFKNEIEKETIDQLAANMDSLKAKSESYGQDQIGE